MAAGNEVHQLYPTYVPRIPADALSAEGVAELYRTRWSVELLFNVAKESFHLAWVATGNG